MIFSFALFHGAHAMWTPLSIVTDLNKYFMLIITCLSLAMLWRYRDRVLFLLTGDDRLHGNALDFIWFGWRKCFAMFPNDCVCFGYNFKKNIGRSMGLLSTPLRLSNLRVGDLPFDDRGDFYLTIECGDHPPITTSVVEDSDPKVVHFFEPINIRLRDNVMENKVIFTVKEEDVFGSKSLCHFSIEAKQVFDMLDDEREKSGKRYILHRFKMEALNGQISETPPWIIMEISSEIDDSLREIEENPNSGMTALMTRKNFGASTQIPMYEKFNAEELKKDFKLLDGQGRVVMEPDESDLEYLREYKRQNMWYSNIFFFILILIISGYMLFRFYVWSCYRQFRDIAIAKAQGFHPPLDEFERLNIKNECNGAVPRTHPSCFPGPLTIKGECRKPGAHPPWAFERLWYDTVGWSNSPLTVQCFSSVCDVRDAIHSNDAMIIFGIIVLIFVFLRFRSYMESRVRFMNAKMAEKMSNRINSVGFTSTSSVGGGVATGEFYTRTPFQNGVDSNNAMGTIVHSPNPKTTKSGYQQMLHESHNTYSGREPRYDSDGSNQAYSTKVRGG